MSEEIACCQSWILTSQFCKHLPKVFRWDAVSLGDRDRSSIVRQEYGRTAMLDGSKGTHDAMRFTGMLVCGANRVRSATSSLNSGGLELLQLPENLVQLVEGPSRWRQWVLLDLTVIQVTCNDVCTVAEQQVAF
ncbi:hypothetical protein [Streptomyces javensis]|uniref:hypothetical protein n=1 Tax=Streptomyces javensis TaxID=114698 RepID=UPI0031F952CE